MFKICRHSLFFYGGLYVRGGDSSSLELGRVTHMFEGYVIGWGWSYSAKLAVLCVVVVVEKASGIHPRVVHTLRQLDELCVDVTVRT